MLQPNDQRLESLLTKLRASYLGFDDEVRNLELGTYFLDMAAQQMDHPTEQTPDKVFLLIEAFMSRFQAVAEEMRRNSAQHTELINEAIAELATMPTSPGEGAYASKNRA